MSIAFLTLQENTTLVAPNWMIGFYVAYTRRTQARRRKFNRFVVKNTAMDHHLPQCDSMLIGDTAAANTYPYIQSKNPSARIEHEATTSKIGEDQLFYFQQRGIDYENAMSAMIVGFCRDVIDDLPYEFASETKQLLSLKLKGSVG